MLPQRLPLNQMQVNWAQQLDPIIANPLLKGVQQFNIPLVTGVNTINHLLGRKYQGYLITGMHNAYAQIFDTPSQLPQFTLVLNASAPTSVDIYVY